ncbi:MAG TPA: peptidase T [bacterium]|nr:peptidase T [bacterium]HQG12992.1 peptidase T [bacterium]
MVDRKRLIDTFVKYTKIDTTSDPESKTTPSTPGQLDLAKLVLEDLIAAGADDCEMSKGGFIFATIKSNIPHDHPAYGKVPVIGLLSHLDTSFDAPGKDVKARFVENYKGGDIEYPAKPGLKLTPENAPHLKNCIGHTIITSDGTTLLGGDDKAGIAVIVELAHYMKDNNDDLHGDIRIAIIPDEEIGVGTEKLDLKKFGADVAYTIDGGEMGEIDIESFNGFMGKIRVEGFSAFPGYGKGIYLNASQVLAKFISKMDDRRWPQNASGRDPIWWVANLRGEIGHAEMDIYLRDFELEGIEKQKSILAGIKKELLKEFPKAKIDIDIKETYKNYKYELDKDPRVVEYAKEAMKRIGLTPKLNYVRGGNDSCHLCFRGLISTNLFIGMQNMHSLNEWNTVETIEAALKTVISLANVWVERSK